MKLDDLKNEVGEAMRMLLDIENKSVMASRSPSPTPSPTRSRSNTPPPSKGNVSMFSQSTAPTKSGGMKSKILTSTVPISTGRIRGPMIEDFTTADYPEGDMPAIDPLIEDAVF